MPAGRGGHDRRWVRTLDDGSGSRSGFTGAAALPAAITAEGEPAAREVIETQRAVLIAASSVTDAATAAAVAATVASAALTDAELAAELAAEAVVETRAAVLTAARTMAVAAAAAARTLSAAVAANAALVEAAAAAAAQARDTEYRLRHDVLHDELTGLGNRRCLVEHLTRALAGSSRNGTAVTVLFLDVDGFKRVNDECGHAVGDQLLIHVAGQLKRLVRESDICARVGGDEFVVIIEDTHASQVEGRVVADRIKAALTAGVAVLGPHTMRVGVSIGVAVSSATSQPRDLLEQADIAMYGTKAQTRLEQGHFHQSGGTAHRIAPGRLPGTGVVHAVVRHAEHVMWTAIARRSVRAVQG